VAVITAAALTGVIAVAGLGLDAGLLYLSHSRLQSAVDSAALAGSLELPYDPDISNGRVVNAVDEFLDRNYPEAQATQVTPGGEARSVEVTAQVDVPLNFLGLVGVEQKTVRAKALAGYNNLEIVMVIDNSGSMKGTPINETNQAAESLVDLVMPDGMAPAVKVGLVPFRGKIRLPDDVDGLPAGCRNADGTYSEWLREEYMDPEYRYPSHYPLYVDDDTCEVIPPVKELTTDKYQIINAINAQDARGSGSGTVISEGLKWGRNVLTPEAPYTEGSGDDDMRKIMILLTDGDTEDGMCGGRFEVWYTPNNYWTNAFFGMGDMDSHCEDGGALNQHALDEAQAAKDAGIEIFCIRFGDSDSTDVQLMKQIASSKPGTDDHYFDAPSAYDIGDVFKLIGKQLGWRLM
jgi:Mg-chelatase subunit ChlD